MVAHMADFRQLIDQAVQKYGLPPEWRDIGYRQLMQESRGKLDAVSPKGAQGPWQFMPKTAKGYGLQNPNDPAASTDAWGRMMADMLKQTGGNPAHALAAYNWGIGNLNKLGMDKMPAETRDYLQKILGKVPIGVQTAQPEKKVYTPAVSAVGATDVQAALAPDGTAPAVEMPPAMPMQQAEQPVYAGAPVDPFAPDQFIERV